MVGSNLGRLLNSIDAENRLLALFMNGGTEVEGTAVPVWLMTSLAPGWTPGTLGILFPYSSERFLSWAASRGGAPIPKLPRGAGTGPFNSKLAILSLRPDWLGKEGLSELPAFVDGDDAALRFSIAAILSFKLTFVVGLE